MGNYIGNNLFTGSLTSIVNRLELEAKNHTLTDQKIGEFANELFQDPYYAYSGSTAGDFFDVQIASRNENLTPYNQELISAIETLKYKLDNPFE